MIIYENNCCDCAVPGYPCIGSGCPYVNIPVYYCDYCDNNNYAKFDIGGEHYCEDCAETYLKDVFEDLTISERAEVLDVNMKKLEG